MSLTVFYNPNDPNFEFNWGWRRPEKDFKDTIEQNPTHQLTAIVKYCLYNKNNSLQLDKCRIIDSLKKIKNTIPEEEWESAIHEMMHQDVFYNGTPCDCLFDYHDTNYGQLEGDPEEEIYEVLLDYMINHIPDNRKMNEAMEGHMREDEFIVKLNNLVNEYKDIASIESIENKVVKILLKNEESEESKTFKNLACKVILSHEDYAAYMLDSHPVFIRFDKKSGNWIAANAKRVRIKKGNVVASNTTTHLNLGKDLNEFDKLWYVYDTVGDFIADNS